jgi:hypothetical protein
MLDDEQLSNCGWSMHSAGPKTLQMPSPRRLCRSIAEFVRLSAHMEAKWTSTLPTDPTLVNDPRHRLGRNRNCREARYVLG